MTTPNPISVFIESQLPDFVRDDNPNFVAFVKAYYEWLDEQGNATYETRKLLDYSDIDRTSEEFISHFITKFLPYFPEDLATDSAKLIKTIREFYSKKGSVEATKFLFRVIYNEDIDILFPKENILKASDGKWMRPRAIRTTITSIPDDYDLTNLKKRRAYGLESNATCIIEAAYKTIDPNTNQIILELFISNVQNVFLNGEQLEISYVDTNGSTVILLSESIIGSITGVVLDPNNRGSNYKTGDPVVLVGGLSSDSEAVNEADVTVNRVESGGIQTISVSKGGHGFTLSDNTAILVNRTAPDTSGSGASVSLTEIDNTKGVTLNLNYDSIYPYRNITINQAGALPNNTSYTDTLGEALTFNELTVYPIKSVRLDSKGFNYTVNPTIYGQSFYNTDVSEADIGTTDWTSTKQNLLNIGKIAEVEILNGGIYYDPSVDKIYVDRESGAGYGANITFTVDAGGSIDSVTVVDGGEGYYGSRGSLQLIIANKNDKTAAANGVGALLRVYRYGEGDRISNTVEGVGRIIDFKVNDRGVGYISQPQVSLRIQDLTIREYIDPIIAFTEGDDVYQGNTFAAATYKAKVDSYANGVLRVYDYSGSPNIALPLTVGTDESAYDVSLVDYIQYGDGSARANAVFFDGVYDYQGYYLNTDGFLSSDKKLQDSRKYHNFSYVLVTQKLLEEYRQTLLDIIHPSGTKLLGYTQGVSEQNETLSVSSYYYESNITFPGTVTVSSGSTTVTGSAGETLFFTMGSSGDLLSIGEGDRKIVKSIDTIVSENELTIDSNTDYFGSGTLEVSGNAQSVTVTVANSESLAIQAADVLTFNVGTGVTNETISSFTPESNTVVFSKATSIFSWMPHNLLKYSEDFSQSWNLPGDGSLAVNSHSDPAGGTTADVYTIGTNGTIPGQSAVSISDSIAYTLSVFIHEDSSAAWMRIRVTTATGNLSAFFNLATGEPGFLSSGFSNAYFVDAGNGWKRYVITYTPAVGNGGSRTFSFAGTAANNSSVADTGETLVLWGAQLNEGDIQPYVPNSTSSPIYPSINTNVPYIARPTYTNVPYKIISQ